MKQKPPVDYIKIAEQLYYHMNPDTKMDVPSFAYEVMEEWYKEWLNDVDTNLNLFNWCLKVKQPK